MESENYTIKTPSFEGPFGVLLNLVEKRKLFINEISLAEVTEEYLKYINNLPQMPAEEASSFLVVASTLILIKSRSLLPNLELTDEEQGDIKNLEERLRLYRLFTKLSGHIRSDFGEKIIFAPLERKPARLNSRSGGNDILVFLPDERITRDSMMTFARDVLGAMPKKVSLPNVEVKKVVSIEEMLDRLVERVKNTLKMTFREFAGHGREGK